MKKLKVSVVGTGYVGLIQAVGLAKFGHDVVCIDIDEDKLIKLKQGIPPIFEIGLEECLSEVLASGRINFSNSMDKVAECDIHFVAVGTPKDVVTGNADLQHLFAAVETIAKHSKAEAIVAIKSTVPIGTCSRLRKKTRKWTTDKELSIVSNPEFLREGSALHDFFNPDRIVLGGDAIPVAEVRKAYQQLEDEGATVLCTDLNSAEIIKYASNAFLATKITFINEIANLTEVMDGDIQLVSKGMGLDERIGSLFLNSGPGYGGSCFPKDTLALVSAGRRFGVSQKILEAVVRENDARLYQLTRRAADLLGGSFEGKRVCVLGLAFKAGTDDTRDSPALSFIHALAGEGAQLTGYDPLAKPPYSLPNYEFMNDPYSAAKDADLLVIMTEWPEFKALDYSKIKSVIGSPKIFDLRSVVDRDELGNDGWTIAAIGHSTHLPD